MLDADHKDHEAAVMSSQMVAARTNSGAIKMFMHKRANLARKHIRWMRPYMMTRMAAVAGPSRGVSMMSPANSEPGRESMKGAQGPRVDHGENAGHEAAMTSPSGNKGAQ